MNSTTTYGSSEVLTLMWDGTTLNYPTLNEGTSKRYMTYLESNFSWAIVYITILFLTIVIGFMGNVFIIVCYVKDETLKDVGRPFVVNLAVCDLMVVIIAEPVCIIGAISGSYYLEKVPFLCQLVASTCLTSCFAAFMTLGSLTFNRYIIICHRGLTKRLFTKNKVIAMIVCSWLLSVCFELPNFIGIGDHIFDTIIHQCIWDRKASVWYTYFIAIGLILLPLLLMLAAYCRMFRVTMNLDNTKQDTTLKQSKMKYWKRSKTLVFVVISFLICWTPYCTVILIDISTEVPGWIHMWTTLLAHLHASTNIIIYMVTSARHRKAYRRLLMKIVRGAKCGANKIADVQGIEMTEARTGYSNPKQYTGHM